MKSNHYTIIISPSDLRPAKKLTLHRSTVIMAVFTGVLLICCGIVGSYKFVEHSNLNAQLEQAKRDISELREANLILMRSKQKERRVREFLGIERSLELPGEPGQGGPGDDGRNLGRLYVEPSRAVNRIGAFIAGDEEPFCNR